MANAEQARGGGAKTTDEDEAWESTESPVRKRQTINTAAPESMQNNFQKPSVDSISEENLLSARIRGWNISNRKCKRSSDETPGYLQARMAFCHLQTVRPAMKKVRFTSSHSC